MLPGTVVYRCECSNANRNAKSSTPQRTDFSRTELLGSALRWSGSALRRLRRDVTKFHVFHVFSLCKGIESEFCRLPSLTASSSEKGDKSFVY